ncbi:MAG: dihydrofolate reductase [Alphaproteobacteria bacterium]|nr:dihydrofolate reductase [Alphaproteobacteria bacterium]
MTIVSIWCRHKGDNVIGAGLGLPWRIPSDTRRFRNLTAGKVKVMGARTYSGMPQKVLLGQKLIILDNTNQCEVFDEKNHQVCADINLLKDYPEDLYISGGATIYALFFKIAPLMPDVVVDCVYNGEISVDAKDLVDVSASVAILEQQYTPLPQRFELDNVITTIWLKKGAFVAQDVVKTILQYMETEGK